MTTKEGKPAHMGEIKAIMTLRNGKQINHPSSSLLFEEKDAKNYEKTKKMVATEKNKKERASQKVEKKPVKVVIKEGIMARLTPPLFPNALKGKKKVNHSPEIFEVLNQVKVNIPLLDMIK